MAGPHKSNGHGLVRASRTTALIAALVCITAMSLGWAAGFAAPAALAAIASPAPGTALPFDMPSTSSLRSSPKKVFAHWVSSLPVSLDNKTPTSDYYAVNYLKPNGEGGVHAAYGGYLRDRPLPRAPRTESNWRLLDMESDVTAAAAEGLDGFTVVMYDVPGVGVQGGDNVELMLQAAKAIDPGFKIILQPDMSAPAIAALSPAALATHLARLGTYSSAYRQSDGRLVISPFKAELEPATWWSQFVDQMQTVRATPTTLWPVFLDEASNSTSFAPLSTVLSHWGGRNPVNNDPDNTLSTSAKGRIARIHSMGKAWMQPISTQDERPRAALFDEAENTTNLRNTWRIAIEGGADLAHLTTWSDFPEGSQMAPTPKHGWSLLDISAYYLTWFKTGAPPPLKRDVAFVTHRTQPFAATPSFPQTKLMALRANGSPARDTVEALTFLTAPARVTVFVGAKAYICQAAAGVDTCTVPLSPGKVSVRVVRDGAFVAGTTSAATVTATPYVQDLEYAASSSGRQPSDGLNGTTTTSTTYVSRQVTALATADSFVNQSAPTANFGTSWSVSNSGTGVQGYLRFVIPPAPAGTTLSTAALGVHTTTDAAAGSNTPFDVRPSGDTWTETGITWNNRPALSGGALGTVPAGTATNAGYTVPLSVPAVKPLLGSQRTFALVATAATSDSFVTWSREQSNAAARPQLQLTYAPDTTAPSTPTGVTSSVVGSAVTLKWGTATDNVGVAGYEVHRGTVAGFATSPATKVATVSGLTWTGAVPSGTSYYRIVAKDAGGNLSAPSASVGPVTGTAPPSPTPSPSPSGTSVVQSVTASADTSVNASAPSTNFGSSWTLLSAGTPAANGYLRFVLPAAPSGRTLTSAVLQARTTTQANSGSAQAYSITLAPDTWAEASMTWANRPTPAAAVLGTITAGTTSDAAFSGPLSVSLLAPHAGQSTTVAITGTGSDSLMVQSREHAADAMRPHLVLTYK